jgi:hypothetical protein
MCGNDIGRSLCAREGGASTNYGYYPCTFQGGMGRQTLWSDSTHKFCGAEPGWLLGTSNCATQVDTAPGEELYTRTVVYFYEKAANSWRTETSIASSRKRMTRMRPWSRNDARWRSFVTTVVTWLRGGAGRPGGRHSLRLSTEAVEL